ncbi:MAG: SUMF1/EgtB/PvdO family nonheme iron enzyme [Planctomycetes bacterium]|jgi:formylglycine-generating enzyme required for sulfatase activity|nr:SUMF1/EgtB/PvdO family nonheme iron enzyme [Planctomycetota bacterium]
MDAKGSADATTTNAPRVFISYSRDTEAHTQAVYEFACGLRKQGLDARTDHFEAFVGDWTSWMVRQVNESDWVLLVCTERYRRLFDEETTEARGVPFEAGLLRALAYRDNGGNRKCMLVALDAERVEFAPLLLQGAMAFALPSQHDALRRALWGVPDGVMPPIGKPQPVLPRHAQLEAGLGSPRSAAEPTGRDSAPERARLAWLQQELTRLRATGQDAAELEAELQRTKEQRVSGMGFRIGADLAGHRLLSRIGKGGFATVWHARRADGQEVALKLLHHHWTDDRTRVDQFFRGAAQMAGLEHPHVVKVIEPRLEWEGNCFFTMQRLGADLGQALPKLDAAGRWAVLGDVVAALEFAHGKGLVHRDVKPSNILLDAEQRGHLADFDLVKAKDTYAMSVGIGDLFYGAPEVLSAVEGAHADARADQYSLALVVLATRDAEILGHGAKAVEHALATAELTPGERKVLARALRAEPGQRFGSVRQMWDQLEAARQGRAGVPRRIGWWVMQAGKVVLKMRRRWWLAFAGLLALAGLSWSGAFLFSSPHASAGDAVARPSTAAGAEDPRERLRRLGLDLVEIPAGSFAMGSGASEVGRFQDEGPVRVVRIPRYWLARTEVTNAQYRAFLEDTNHRTPERWFDSEWNAPDQPVVGVSWEDAVAFCNWAGLRLPTESEWEYACRAGTLTAFAFGDNISPEQANYDGSLSSAGASKGRSRACSVQVGSLPANAWGLHEMHGNVWEWCEDWVGDYRDAPVDGSPQRQDHGLGHRVLRGGSWINIARACRSAFRQSWPPGFRAHYVGFRPASSLP